MSVVVMEHLNTAPEYCEGDRCRPPSPAPVPVVHRRESLKAESSFIKDEPRPARSSDNDNDGKQGQSHAVARSFQQPSAERQYNPPGGQSNLIVLLIVTLGTASHASVKQLQSRSEVIPVHRQMEMIAVMRMQDVTEAGSVMMIVAVIVGTVATVPKVVGQVPEVLVPSVAILHQSVRSAG